MHLRPLHILFMILSALGLMISSATIQATEKIEIGFFEGGDQSEGREPSQCLGTIQHTREPHQEVVTCYQEILNSFLFDLARNAYSAIFKTYSICHRL